MKRIHLFEFEDLDFMPIFLREYLTDYLRYVGNLFGILNPSLEIIIDTLKASGKTKIVDLCSGGGGAWLSLYPKVREEIPEAQIILTDLYPNQRAIEFINKESEGIRYKETSVNAVDIDESVDGLRTQCLSFHHFPESSAVRLIQNAVDNGDPILIIEGQERSLRTLIQFAFVPIFVLLLTPFIRPFSLGRLIFTYLIPIVPLLVLWDGLVSVLRTYSTNEMAELVMQVNGNENYSWDIGRIEQRGMINLFLKGVPKKE